MVVGLGLVGYQIVASPRSEDPVLAGFIALLLAAALGLVSGHRLYGAAMLLGLMAGGLVVFGVLFMTTGRASNVNTIALALGAAFGVLAIVVGAVAMYEGSRSARPESPTPASRQ